ncbi:DegV family protein [Radiobacillus sp. PE A8.2]|uniref:DegV family protein n=1 Tax=Radiobacillus sp. PE A8.2 TaxID=3380349 RepID=UPI00388D1A1C
MKKIKLMTDSSADIPKTMQETYDIEVVPLYVHFGNEQYKSGVTIDTATFNQKIKDSDDFPLSSAPGPNEFYEAFKCIDSEVPIILLAISDGISSTYNHALLGKKMLLDEEPERKIEVINTKTASSGMILLLDEAIKKTNEGYHYEELVTHLYEKVESTITLFVLKTVENLVRGGRLDRVKGAIVKTLNIRLLMRASEEGTIEVTEKVRGEKKSIRRFIDQIGSYTKNVEDKMLAMTHCNAEDWANHVLQEIKNVYPFKETTLAEMGPAISTHAGEGGLVIAFFKDKLNSN